MLVMRELTPSDLPAVVSLERATYPEILLEGESEFTHKLGAFGEGALGFFDNGVLAAYMFCHPWKLGEVFKLGSGRFVIPEHANCIYIHDLAVARKYRGRGLATQLMSWAYRLAEEHGLEYCALVAVLGSARYWERRGFVVHHELEYRPGIWASYMIKKLS